MLLQRVPPGADGGVALAREGHQPEAEQHQEDGDAQALDEPHVRAARLRRGVDRDAALRRARGGHGGGGRRVDRRASKLGPRRRGGRSEGVRRGRGGHVALILLALGCAVRAGAALAELAMVARLGGLAEGAARHERQVALQPRLTLCLLGLSNRGATFTSRRVTASPLLHLLGPARRRWRTPSERWARRGWCQRTRRGARRAKGARLALTELTVVAALRLLAEGAARLELEVTLQARGAGLLGRRVIRSTRAREQG
mmetsp:Transcript_59117/g.141742  ORF Transcript_59117/g.141742 Transcript_59117/m.141742 type:complete len:257 (-) Transcript_59117:59-829(-)